MSAIQTKRKDSSARPEARWMLLIHQIPPTPAYFRVKVWRHLRASAPSRSRTRSTRCRTTTRRRRTSSGSLREIVKGGGDASICRGALRRRPLRRAGRGALPRGPRADYRELAEEARAGAAALPSAGRPRRPAEPRWPGRSARLRSASTEIAAIDFFGAPGREVVEGCSSGLEARMQNRRRPSRAGQPLRPPATCAGAPG